MNVGNFQHFFFVSNPLGSAPEEETTEPVTELPTGEFTLTIGGGGDIHIEPFFQGYLLVSIDGGGTIVTDVQSGGILSFSIDGGGDIDAEAVAYGQYVDKITMESWADGAAATGRSISIPDEARVDDIMLVSAVMRVTNSNFQPAVLSTWALPINTGITGTLDLHVWSKRLTRADIDAGSFGFTSTNVPIHGKVEIFRNVRVVNGHAGWASSSGTTFTAPRENIVGDNTLLQDYVVGTINGTITSNNAAMGEIFEQTGGAVVTSTIAGYQSAELWDAALSPNGGPSVTYTYSSSSATRGLGYLKLSPYSDDDNYPYGTHRYWRILPLANVSGSFELNEVEMHDVFGGTDLCTGGTASASSGTAANAFDNNTATLWTAGNNTAYAQSINYDFGVGVSKDVIEVVLGIGTNNGRAPTSFKVQYSDDNSKWATAWTVEGISAWSANTTRTFQNQIAAAEPPNDPGGDTQPRVRSWSSASAFTHTLDFPKPAGLAVDDLLVAIVNSHTYYATITTPAGWTRQVDANARTQVLTKLADAGDVAGSTITLANLSPYTGQPVVGSLVAVKDVDTAAPVMSGGAVALNGAGANMIRPAVTASGTNRLLLALAGSNDAASFPAAPTGQNLVVQKALSGGNLVEPASCAIAEIPLGTTTGSISSTTWPGTSSKTGYGYALIIKGP
jgi:hypothetical protein